MPRALWCRTCLKPPQVLVVGPNVWKCASCGEPVCWREMGDVPFTLTLMDRKLLRSFHIGVDDAEVKG